MTITTTNADGTTVTSDRITAGQEWADGVLSAITAWQDSTEADTYGYANVPVQARAIVEAARDAVIAAGWESTSQGYGATVEYVFRDLLGYCPAIDADEPRRVYFPGVVSEIRWTRNTLADGTIAPTIGDVMTAWEREQEAAAIVPVSLVKVTAADLAARDADIARLTTELADAREERGAYRVQAYAARNALEAFKVQVAEVGERYAIDHGFCSVYDQLIDELGLERPSQSVQLTYNVRVTVRATFVGSDRDDATSTYAAERAFDDDAVGDAIAMALDSDEFGDVECVSVSVDCTSAERSE